MSATSNLQSHARYFTTIIALLLTVATFAAYANSFSVPFVFDDQTSITTNLTIQHLWSLGSVLSPPVGETVGGRPLVNLSLALNYAISGLEVWSYHFVNVLIHLCAGLTLFGVVRRTLARTRPDRDTVLVAGSIALVWLLHPLQTESVTYVIQRAEALVSLCYLLTLYCVIRYIEAPQRQRWAILAVLICTMGMACKEVMVTAPFIVLLYDRTFVAGSFRRALQQRRALYIGLFASLAVLGYLVAAGGRGGTAGFKTKIGVASYALTQSRAIVTYLRLAIWPHPLVFDYGTPVDTLGADAGYLAIVGLLVVITAIGLWKRPVIGFVGAAFFAILAPSSSIVPIMTQTIAEHRMYLALALVVIPICLVLQAKLGRSGVGVMTVWALGLGYSTYLRNQDYRSEYSIWEDTAEKVPTNFRAQHNMGRMLAGEGKFQDALAHYREAVRLNPNYDEAPDNLIRSLILLGKLDEAKDSASKAEVLRPYRDSVDLQVTLGRLMVFLNRNDEAAERFKVALATDPNLAMIQNELGKALGRSGKLEEAVVHFKEAIRLDSTYVEAKSNLELANNMMRARGGGKSPPS